jgi:DNA-binding transcriptional regulator YdaS (Cro superfamily)
MDNLNLSNFAGEHAIDRASRLFGGRARLAEHLGVSPSALGNWKVRGVPVEYCVAIEQATGSALTRIDLRPDDWHKYWPELSQALAKSMQPATDFVAEQGASHV